MKLKLDENVPRSAADVLVAAGHDVSTVAEENLVGAEDDEVVRVAAGEDRLLVTLDRGLADARARLPGAHAGIVVLRLRDQGAASATRALRRLEEETGFASLAGCITVVQEWSTRIRRPNPSDP